MKELKVVLSDDLIYSTTGQRVPADETITIVLDGQARELDLTAEHAKELREMLADYLTAGRPPEPEPAPPARHRPAPGGRRHGRGALKLGRVRMARMRKWVDENHVRSLKPPDRPAYLTSTGKNYSPDWLLHAYATAMAERGEHDEWIDRWAQG